MNRRSAIILWFVTLIVILGLYALYGYLSYGDPTCGFKTCVQVTGGKDE